MLNLETPPVATFRPLGRIDRPLTGTALDLCEAVCEHITANPELFDQRGLRHSVVWWLVTLHDGPGAPPAGDWIAWLDRARALLGMPTEHDDLLDYVALLFAFTPPGKPGTEAYARDGVQRLRGFIAANQNYLRNARVA